MKILKEAPIYLMNHCRVRCAHRQEHASASLASFAVNSGSAAGWMAYSDQSVTLDSPPPGSTKNTKGLQAQEFPAYS